MQRADHERPDRHFKAALGPRAWPWLAFIDRSPSPSRFEHALGSHPCQRERHLEGAADTLRCQWLRGPELEASLDFPGPGNCARPGTPRADSVPARDARRSPGLVACRPSAGRRCPRLPPPMRTPPTAAPARATAVRASRTPPRARGCAAPRPLPSRRRGSAWRHRSAGRPGAAPRRCAPAASPRRSAPCAWTGGGSGAGGSASPASSMRAAAVRSWQASASLGPAVAITAERRRACGASTPW